MHVLLSALPYTKRSCGIDICYTEVLRTECWPRQGSHFPKQKIAGRNSNCLFQPNPNILLSPCWSSTLHGCTGMQVSRYPLAAGSSDRTKRCLKENIHRRRDQAGKKWGKASKLVDKQANKGSMSTYVSWQYSNCVSPELCIYLKAFGSWVFWNLNLRLWKKIGLYATLLPQTSTFQNAPVNQTWRAVKNPFPPMAANFFPNPHHQPLNPLSILLFFLLHFNSSWTLKPTIFCNCSRKTKFTSKDTNSLFLSLQEQTW